MLPDECREQIFPPPRDTLLTYDYSRGEHPRRSRVVGLSYYIKEPGFSIISSTTVTILQRLVDLPAVVGSNQTGRWDSCLLSAARNLP